MNQSFESVFDFNEDTEIDSTGNFSFEFVTNFVLGNQILLFLILNTFFREDEFSFLWKCSDDSNRELGSNEFLELFEDSVLVAVSNTWIVICFELGSREEALDTLPFDDKTTFVCFLNREFKNSLLCDCDFCLAPNHCLTSFLEGEFDITIFVSHLNNFC